MWVEGFTNHTRIINDLAKIFCTSNKDEFGKIIKDKNWELIYPLPYRVKSVTEIVMVDMDGSQTKYQAPEAMRRFSDTYRVKVYEDNDLNDAVLLPATEYTVDYPTGTITFKTPRVNRVRADFTYIEQDYDIYQIINSIQNRVVLRTKIPAQAASAADDPFGNDKDQHKTHLEMYVEFYQTPYIYNPEKPVPAPIPESYEGFDGFQWDIDPITGQPRPNYHFINVRYFDRWDPVKLQPGPEVIDYLTCPVIDMVSGNIIFLPGESAEARTIHVKDETPSGRMIVLSVTEDGKIGYYGTDQDGKETFTEFTEYVDFNTGATVKLKLDEESGHKIFEGGHASPWYKWSWYRDFEEVLNDTIDEDPSQNDLDDGISFRYVETPGIDKQIIPIKFHASTDNVKTAIVLQGDPSLNYDNYLISFGYFGSVESYYEKFYTAEQETDPVTGDPICVPIENKEYYSNDTAGNFLVTVGSSTSPARKVKRDVITGAVVSMEFDQTWGVNTGDGSTDFSMFKTRSGLYFQKHHPAFVTPEQFLQKEMFNPSRWTGCYNLAQVHVVHGHDGYRGLMRNVVVVDDAALDHENELIIREKQAEQKIYKFFAVSAPYSFIRNSPNVQYGIAILKE